MTSEWRVAVTPAEAVRGVEQQRDAEVGGKRVEAGSVARRTEDVRCQHGAYTVRSVLGVRDVDLERRGVAFGKTGPTSVPGHRVG